jgi:antitoxin (DNA-binding transcriptional repressor) of toxin-antitoxin stability system
LSRYLDHVRAGGTVVVCDRNVPVAQIVPIERARSRKQEDEERLARLERKGLIRRGKGDMLEWMKHHKPVKIPGGLLKTLLEERESGW